MEDFTQTAEGFWVAGAGEDSLAGNSSLAVLEPMGGDVLYFTEDTAQDLTQDATQLAEQSSHPEQAERETDQLLAAPISDDEDDDYLDDDEDDDDYLDDDDYDDEEYYDDDDDDFDSMDDEDD